MLIKMCTLENKPTEAHIDIQTKRQKPADYDRQNDTHEYAHINNEEICGRTLQLIPMLAENANGQR